jgi:flagellar motor switch protein FliG
MRLKDVKEIQDNVLNIIRELDQSGDIIIPYSKGETTE